MVCLSITIWHLYFASFTVCQYVSRFCQVSTVSQYVSCLPGAIQGPGYHFKLPHGIEPCYLSECLFPAVSALSVRAERIGTPYEECNLLVPRRHGFSVSAPGLQNEASLRSRQLSSQWRSGRPWWAGCSPTARVGNMDALAGYVCLCFSMNCPSYKFAFIAFVLPKIGNKLVNNKLCVREKMNEKGRRDFLCLEIIRSHIAATFSFMCK